jgi:hypothetical protein
MSDRQQRFGLLIRSPSDDALFAGHLYATDEMAARRLALLMYPGLPDECIRVLRTPGAASAKLPED